MISDFNYLDGNAAAGELGEMFATDITIAEVQCANCGATKRFAETHLYMSALGLVARCAVCEQVLLRLVALPERVLLDVRGMTYLSLNRPQRQARSA